MSAATTFLAPLLADPASPAPGCDDWASLLAELRADQMTPFVYARLRAGPVWRGLPAAVQRELAEDFQSHSVRTFLMETELERIVAALAAANVQVLLLKGAALGRLVYASPAERPVGDLDLLIRAEQVETARQALARQGYQAQGLYWLPCWQRRYRAELPLVGRAPERQDLLVELHWALVELPYYIDRIPMDEIWQTARLAPDLPSAMLPDPASLLLHSCAHLALHHSQDQRLLWLVDVDRLARWQAMDWDLALERATRWGLQLALRTVLLQAEDQLGTPLPVDVRERMAHWQPAPVEQAMWGLGDERPGRAVRRARTTWAAMNGRQRLRYAAWLGLRGLLWGPEQMSRGRRWTQPTG